MLKKLIAIVLTATVLCTSTSASAQKSSTISPEADQTARISPLRKGNPAPFTGVLFSPKATATVIAELESFDEKMKIEVDKAVRDVISKKQFELNESESRCITSKTILQAEIDTKSARIKRLSKDVADAQSAAANPPSRVLWAGLGVIVGAVTTVLITFAVNQASK